MSGPVSEQDAIAPNASPPPATAVLAGPVLDVVPARAAEVGGATVRRALPRRPHRTVGAWCFLDHFGPSTDAMHVGPHPHIGLQTVTWLVDGAVLHTDSLGSEQLVLPGQLNLMTAGRGVAHAEESRETGGLHGVQLWVAQPEATRWEAPAFEHHADLPVVELDGWQVRVIVGAVAGERSPARADTPLLGAEITAGPGTRGAVPLRPEFEHALVVLDGAVDVEGTSIRPGSLAYLGSGRVELPLAAAQPARALLIGGEPFGEELLMWWNYVARTREEVEAAHRDWEAHSERFGTVRSRLARIPSPPPVWARPR